MIGGLLIEFRQRSQCSQTWDVYGGCDLDYQIKSYKSLPRKTREEASWRKLASRVFEPALAQRPQSFCGWSEAVFKVVKAMSSWHNNGWERLLSRVEALLLWTTAKESGHRRVRGALSEQIGIQKLIAHGCVLTTSNPPKEKSLWVTHPGFCSWTWLAVLKLTES